MLPLTIADTELFDENRNRFIRIKGRTIQLEHSLLSISKWESKWKRAFLTLREKTDEESLDYIRCMTTTPDVDPNLYYAITPAQRIIIQAYINDPMSATRFRGESGKGGSAAGITSDKLYAQMALLGIPFSCEKWHLNRLITLIHLCETMGSGKKMSRGESAKYMREMHAARKAGRGRR